MRVIRHLTALVAALTLLAACQSPEPETPAATLAATPPPTTPATSTASASATPAPSPEDYTVPAVIDEAYVQRVLTALYDLESEALRQMVAANAVTPEAEATFRAVTRTELVERDLETYRQDAVDGFPGVLRPPGNQVVDLEELISAYPDCLFARTRRDYSQVVSDASSLDGETYVQLLIKPNDPTFDRNPTPWILGGTLLTNDGQRPEDPCLES